MVRSNKKPKKVRPKYATNQEENKGILLNEIKPRTPNQDRFFKSIENNIISVANGPAGCGKSIISIGKACHALAKGDIDQIIVARSIIGCGKELGALPGDVDQKVHAYFLPIIEYLHYFLGRSVAQNLIKSETIKLLPVELIRGHTYDYSYMILEEVQNCDKKQLKLFMSRIGTGSKMILLGDENQSDIPQNISCMPFLLNEFGNVDGMAINHLDYSDILRHSIIPDILKIFDKQ